MSESDKKVENQGEKPVEEKEENKKPQKHSKVMREIVKFINSKPPTHKRPMRDNKDRNKSKRSKGSSSDDEFEDELQALVHEATREKLMQVLIQDAVAKNRISQSEVDEMLKMDDLD